MPVTCTHVALTHMTPTSGLVCARRPESLDIDWVIEEEEQTYTQNLYDILSDEPEPDSSQPAGQAAKAPLLRFTYSSTVHRTTRVRPQEATAPESVEKARGDRYWLD